MQNYRPASLRVAIEYVGACNNLHYYPQMEQFDWLEMMYYKVIVIAQCQGFMEVNKPSPRAYPEDEVCVLCHKSHAGNHAITFVYM